MSIFRSTVKLCLIERCNKSAKPNEPIYGLKLILNTLLMNYNCQALAKARAREKRQSAFITNNVNEAEKGRRRVELAYCVRSGDKDDELELHRSLKAGLSYFTVKLVIITREFVFFFFLSKSQDCLVMVL